MSKVIGPYLRKIFFRDLQNGFSAIQDKHEFPTDAVIATALKNGGILPASYAGDPTNHVTPLYTGQICINTTNHFLYYSTGLTTADWQKLYP